MIDLKKDRLYKILCLVMLIVILVVTLLSNQSNNWRKETVESVSFEYPRDWRMDLFPRAVRNGNNVLFMLNSPDLDYHYNTDDMSVSAHIDNLSENADDLSEDDFKKYISGIVTNHVVGEMLSSLGDQDIPLPEDFGFNDDMVVSSLDYDGNRGYLVSFSCNYEGIPYWSKNRVIIIGGKIYTFASFCKKEFFEQWKSDIDKIFESISIDTDKEVKNCWTSLAGYFPDSYYQGDFTEVPFFELPFWSYRALKDERSTRQYIVNSELPVYISISSWKFDDNLDTLSEIELGRLYRSWQASFLKENDNISAFRVKSSDKVNGYLTVDAEWVIDDSQYEGRFIGYQNYIFGFIINYPSRTGNLYNEEFRNLLKSIDFRG